MRYTRKRPICASTRNKWVEHPVTRFYDGAHHNLSSYFLYEGENVVAMINPVYDKKTDTLAYRLDVVDPNTGKSRTIEEQCTSSREAMDVYDERKDYFINESTKTRKVECSMRKRASVRAAMTDDEFYTRKFPTVKVGEVKVAPQRGNWTVFIGLSDGTIAYQWCESKEAARRESEYAKSIVKKYGSDAPYWAEEGYKIWNPNVKSAKKSVSCARRFTVKASTTAKRRNDSVMCATMSAAAKDLYNDLYEYAKEYRFTSRWTADGIKKYLKRQQDFRRMSDAEFYGVVEKVNKDFKRKEKVKSYPYSEDSYKSDDVKSAKSVKCSTKRRCSIKASVSDSEIDELYRIANNEVLPTTKLYKIAGICDIDDDTFDFTYTGTAFGAYLTYIIHVGISSSDIDLYTFMRKEWDDLFPDIRRDNPYGNYVQINLDVMVSGDRISVDIADADVYEKDTYSEYYSKKFADAFDVDAIERYIADIADPAVNEIASVLSQYIPEDDVMESVRCSRSTRRRSARAIEASADYGSQSYKVLRVLRDHINMEFNKTMIGDVEVYVGDIYETTNDAFAFDVSLDPQNDYECETKIKVVSSDELYAKNVFYCKVGLDVRNGGYFEISRFGAKGILADKIDEIAESISSGDSVNSAKSIKCGAMRKDDSVDPIDSEFMVDLYYSPNHKGRAGDRYFYDWSEAESYAHDALMNGLYVSIWNKNNGDTLDISPDEYNEAWENGAADFDINEDIVNFKRRIVESAKSIKCATITYRGKKYDADTVSQYYDMSITNYDDLGATTDQEFFDEYIKLDPDFVSLFDYDITPIDSAKSIKCSDDTDLTVDISNLELGEPYYEYREDDPENPDKWVLVIGKDVEKKMNFKLWYYVDSTDADLSELDLSNPDHIDLDEMSTMDDYEEIQLSQDIKCSTVTDMHGNQVNLVTL